MDTPRKGNLLLEFAFDCLNSRDGSIKDIPPFLVFKRPGMVGISILKGWPCPVILKFP